MLGGRVSVRPFGLIIFSVNLTNSPRRKPVELHVLQQILDEPEAFGTGLQPVRNGESSE